MKKQVYKKVNFWDGCCTHACEEEKYSEEKTVSKASKKIQCNVRTERREVRVESKTDQRRAKAIGKSKQVQSSELRCQEDGKGPHSCCCCSLNEGFCSAVKLRAGGPQSTFFP